MTVADVLTQAGLPLGRRTGHETVLCCPFHHERTPSFSYRDNVWRCWGCGEAGNAYQLAVKLGVLRTTFPQTFPQKHLLGVALLPPMMRAPYVPPLSVRLNRLVAERQAARRAWVIARMDRASRELRDARLLFHMGAVDAAMGFAVEADRVLFRLEAWLHGSRAQHPFTPGDWYPA